MEQNNKKLFIRKILLPFSIGMMLLITSFLTFEFGGHRNHTKAFLLLFPGVILSGTFGIGLIQYLIYRQKNK